MREAYPNIHRAALAIAIDNGGLNRWRSEKQIHKEIAAWLAKQPDDLLKPIDEWLGRLSQEQFEMACSGAEDDAVALLSTAPPFTDELLNRYFDEVC